MKQFKMVPSNLKNCLEGLSIGLLLSKCHSSLEGARGLSAEVADYRSGAGGSSRLAGTRRCLRNQRSAPNKCGQVRTRVKGAPAGQGDNLNITKNNGESGF